MTTRSETERFIYYDGLVPAPDYLRCTGVTEAGVTVKNTAKFPIANLFFVDRRADRKNKDWAVAYRAEAIPAGGEATIPLQAVRPAKASDDIAKLMRSARQSAAWHGPLSGGGRFDPENLAQGLLRGRRADRLLALAPGGIRPDAAPGSDAGPGESAGPRRHRPSSAFRGGATGRESVSLSSSSNSTRTVCAQRDRPTASWKSLGPWAVPQIREALAKKPSLETTRRLEAILQKADASEWLKQTVPAPKPPAK